MDSVLIGIGVGIGLSSIFVGAAFLTIIASELRMIRQQLERKLR